jgi:Fuc2NAc and GlcNAc transferase
VTTVVLVACGVAIAAGVGTAMLRTRASAWGLMDIPNERSLHSRATPRGGGIVIVLTVLLGLAVVAAIQMEAAAARVAAFVMASGIVAGIGWLDDFRSLPPAAKFTTHLGAAALAIATWGAFDRVHPPGGSLWVLAPLVAVAVTALWLVGLLNAYNFMDGVDGIASMQGVIAGLFWAWGSGVEVALVRALGLMIAAASLGFLWHNRPPARIFLGDAGSGFLGFAFGVLPLIAYAASGDARVPVAGILVVWPFVFDTVFTFTRRLVRRENVIRAHRSHLYQRLVLSGWSHRRVAALYSVLATWSAVMTALWLGGASGWVIVGPVLGTMSLAVVVPAVERRKTAIKRVATSVGPRP